MLALIAAMTVAAAATDPGVATPAAAQVRARTPLLRTLGPEELAARRHCKDAARVQTGYEPALLYRQDKDSGRARRLIDLPDGAYCLVSPAVESTSGGK